jgi:sodium transport system permease protein
MNLAHARIIYFKELTEALRDRRTLISAILIPMIMFPVLMLGFGGMASHSLRKVQQEGSSVMVLAGEHSPALVEVLRKSPGLHLVPAAKDFQPRIEQKKLRAAIEIPPNFDARLQAGNSEIPELKIYFYAGETRSYFAVRTLQRILRDYSDQIVSQRLTKQGLSTNILIPFKTQEENVVSAEKVGGNAVGGIIPYMIIFLCFVGAMAPAMDLTAGEKERGTIETILATPVDRTDLVFGKFLLVLTTSVITSIISLASFAMTFALPFQWAQEVSRMGPRGVPFDLSFLGIFAVFCLVFPVAVMFSAGLLAICSIAKTSKEAQSYVSPLLMLAIMPAMGAMLPGFDLNLKWAFAPILNVSLVSKEVLTGVYQWGLIGVVFLSSCFYAALALITAILLFRRESVLFRS